MLSKGSQSRTLVTTVKITQTIKEDNHDYQTQGDWTYHKGGMS